MRLRQKIAIVTAAAAAAGFGEGIARLFAQEGARLVLADRDRAGVERVAREIGRDAAAFVRAVADNCGGFDIVVNNANFITGILLPVDGGRTA